MRIPVSLRKGLTLLCLACGVAQATAAAQEKPGWIGQANNAFAFDLYDRLAMGNSGSLFFSPSSIQTVLAMAYAGARGTTAAQMETVLHLPPGSDGMHREMGAFLKGLNERGTGKFGQAGFVVSEADALWGQKGYGFLPGFINLLKADYGAGLEEVDFKNGAEAARAAINAWAEKKTHDRIKGLIGPRVLTPLTRLVLTNAIYFKASWLDPFDRKRTGDEPFYLPRGGSIKVPMMRGGGQCGYLEGDDFQALELTYSGDQQSMIILLPRSPDGLPKLEKEFTPEKFAATVGNLKHATVKVTMPRFKLTEEFALSPTLEAMGMKSAFEDADFSGMTGNRDLAISEVIHKAFLDVNEEGTEAAAATAVAMTMSLVPAKIYEFHADHPFLFMIRDESSGVILFMGRLTNPAPEIHD